MIPSFSNKQAERMTAVAMPIIASLTKDLSLLTRLFMDVMLPEVLYLKLFLERHGLWFSIWRLIIFNLSIIYRDFSSLKKGVFDDKPYPWRSPPNLPSVLHVTFWVDRFPVCYISRGCTLQTVSYLGSYFKPQLSKKFLLFLLIFQSIIKFIMEKEDLNYFRASIFFQNSLVSAATS